MKLPEALVVIALLAAGVFLIYTVSPWWAVFMLLVAVHIIPE